MIITVQCKTANKFVHKGEGTVSTIKRKTKITGIIFLTIIIIIQAIALVYMGFQKKGMHIDEFYSYILANSYGSAKISYDSQVWNNWLSGNDFTKFVTVEKGEQFAYDRVYYNNTLDTHPPLFYFLLHTVCSFFPDQYSPWFGIALNIAIMLAVQIALFFFAKEVTDSYFWGLVPVAIYGGMKAFFDTTLFIRMYALLTLFTVLLAWKHYHLIKNPQKRSTIIWCFVITFLGTFTQYYFAVYAFFMAVSVCIWRLIRRDAKTMFIYGGAMAAAIICVFAVYPAGITHITGSETNNVGNTVMENMFDFSKLQYAVNLMFQQADEIITAGITNNFIFASCILIATLLLSFIFRTKLNSKEKAPEIKDFFPVLILLFVLIATIILISHISAEFVYVRYIYNLFPLYALVVSSVLYLAVNTIKLNQLISATGFVAIWLASTINLIHNNNCSYLFEERFLTDNRIINTYEEYPLIFINNGTTYQPTALLHYIFEAQQVHLADYADIEDTNTFFSNTDCHNGAIFIVLTDKYWSEGFDGDEVMKKIISDSSQFNTYICVGFCDFSTIYLAYSETQ